MFEISLYAESLAETGAAVIAPERAPARRAPRAAPSPSASLSAIEWLVVAHAVHSCGQSLRWSRMAPLLELYRPEGPGGDDRLEALSRMAWAVSRHGWSVPALDILLFLRAGWREAHLELLVETLAE